MIGKYVDLIFTAVVSAFIMAGCINDRDDEGACLEVGDKLPEFEVMMSNGSLVSAASLAGNVSCIVFFHTSCPDCRKTLPVIQEIYDAYAENGVSFAVISRSEPYVDVWAYFNENGLKIPFSAQKTRAVYSLFANSGIPRVYIADRDGIVRHIFTDNPVPSYDELSSALESVLN